MTAISRPRVLIVFGGRSSEHEISCSTAAGILTAIDRTKWDVIPLGITRDGQWVHVADDPSALAFKDGTAANRAATQLGNESLAQLVQQRAAEQDRDARGARERVDIRARGDLDIGGVHAQRAAVLIKVDLDPVQAQQVRDHVGVADKRHVVELRGGVGEQRRDHRLGDEVFRAAHRDLTAQRMAALNLKDR